MTGVQTCALPIYVLPIASTKTVALVGPLANAKENMTGTWSVGADNTKSITLLKGLTEAIGTSGKLKYAKGCNLDFTTMS